MKDFCEEFFQLEALGGFIAVEVFLFQSLHTFASVLTQKCVELFEQFLARQIAAWLPRVVLVAPSFPLDEVDSAIALALLAWRLGKLVVFFVERTIFFVGVRKYLTTVVVRQIKVFHVIFWLWLFWIWDMPLFWSLNNKYNMKYHNRPRDIK